MKVQRVDGRSDRSEGVERRVLGLQAPGGCPVPAGAHEVDDGGPDRVRGRALGPEADRGPRRCDPGVALRLLLRDARQDEGYTVGQGLLHTTETPLVISTSASGSRWGATCP